MCGCMRWCLSRLYCGEISESCFVSLPYPHPPGFGSGSSPEAFYFHTVSLWAVDKFLDRQNNGEPAKESVSCVGIAYVLCT